MACTEQQSARLPCSSTRTRQIGQVERAGRLVDDGDGQSRLVCRAVWEPMTWPYDRYEQRIASLCARICAALQ